MYWSQMLCGTRIEILCKENRIKLAKKYKQWVVVKIKEQLFECNCWKFHSPLPAERKKTENILCIDEFNSASISFLTNQGMHLSCQSQVGKTQNFVMAEKLCEE